MICVSVAEPTVKGCLVALEDLDFAEVRLDGMNVSVEDVRLIFSRPLALIATFMPGCTGLNSEDTVDDDTRKKLLIAAIEAGARYVDVEIQADIAYRKEIIEKAKQHDCKVIISFHDFQATPEKERLEEIAELCFREGGDVAKIACRVNHEKDNLRLLGLLNNGDYHGKMIVIGMGDKGKITRVTAPFLGSLFTFASIAKGKETAAGQIEKSTLEDMMRMFKNE